MKHTSPRAWVTAKDAPVSLIPLRRRVDIEHIFRGVEFGLRQRGIALTDRNLMRFFSTDAGQVYSLRKRLVASGLMQDFGSGLVPTETGRRKLIGGDDEAPLATPDRDIVVGSKPHQRRKVTDIDGGKVKDIARRYEALRAIADNPDAMAADISGVMGYANPRKSGASAVIARLAEFGLVERTEAQVTSAQGHSITGYRLRITDAGRAKLATQSGVEA